MQTLGIDLSTDPRKAWACELDWSRGEPVITALTCLGDQPDPRAAPRAGKPPRLVRDEGALIAALAELIAQFAPSAARPAGIDSPFGWPSEFVRAIADWSDGDAAGFRKRPELRLRATDRFVQAVSGLTPMSVSADRIGSTAMLCVEVLSRLAHGEARGRYDLARGADGLAEVYPAAALRMWTMPGGEPLPADGYKAEGDRGRAARAELVPVLLEATGTTAAALDRARMIQFDDALDAFVCALIARALTAGGTFSLDAIVDPGDVWLPARAAGDEARANAVRLGEGWLAAGREVGPSEGWIHIPRRQPIRAGLGLA